MVRLFKDGVTTKVLRFAYIINRRFLLAGPYCKQYTTTCGQVTYLFSDVRVRYGVQKPFRQWFVRPSHRYPSGAFGALIFRPIAACGLPRLSLSRPSVPLCTRLR